MQINADKYKHYLIQSRFKSRLFGLDVFLAVP